jgi:signal transduction histidine kinase/CheY-like chemotaxis protein
MAAQKTDDDLDAVEAARAYAAAGGGRRVSGTLPRTPHPTSEGTTAEEDAERARFVASLGADRMAALSTLAAGAAHEIGNPLTYLLMNVEHVLRKLRAVRAQSGDAGAGALQSEDSNDLVRSLVASLEQAVDGGERVRQVVRNLMTFAQGDVEERRLLDVRSIMESSVQMAWHDLRVRARVVRAMNDVPLVRANEARLGQVFSSLLANAAQAIPEGNAARHEVRVATSWDESGDVIVEIGDTGSGVRSEDLPRVFDPFFTTKPGHLGLGLSISLGSIECLGGGLTLESRAGAGTTVRVRLPVAKSTRRAVLAPAVARAGFTSGSAPGSTQGARARVLVVDDDPMVAAAVARVLGRESDVVVKTSGESAFDLLSTGERFDVILCDLMMPTMSGMDFYAAVMRAMPDAAGSIVFLSGGAFTPRAKAFLRSVTVPCLEKPVDTAELRALVRRKIDPD